MLHSIPYFFKEIKWLLRPLFAIMGIDCPGRDPLAGRHKGDPPPAFLRTGPAARAGGGSQPGGPAWAGAYRRVRAGGGLETAGRSAGRRLRPRRAGGPRSGPCSSAPQSGKQPAAIFYPSAHSAGGRSTSRPWAGDGLPRCFPAPRCEAILRRARRDRRLFIARQRKTGGGAHAFRRFRPPGTRARGRGTTARRRGPLRAPRRAWRESPGIALFGAKAPASPFSARGCGPASAVAAAGRHPAAIVFCRPFPFSVRAERGAGPVRRSSAPRRAALRGPPLSPLLPGPGFFHLPGPASFFAVGGPQRPRPRKGAHP